MILKIDHISYSCNDGACRDKFPDYQLIFSEPRLKNAPCKSSFFSEPRDWHDLIMLRKKGFVPVELTVYDGGLLPGTNMRLVGNTVTIESPCPARLAEFFRLCGFRRTEPSDDALIMAQKAMLDAFSLTLKILERGDADDGWLDAEGFSSLAFFVDNISREREKFMDNSFPCSEVCRVRVNSRNLQVCFARCEGCIVELISVGRNSDKV